MIAIKKGTSSYRHTSTLAADEVEFTGEFLWESDGFTPAMIWDAGLNNIRPMTQAEKDARDAPGVQERADKTALRTAASQAISDNDIFLSDQNVTTAEAIAQVKKLTVQVNAVIKALRRIV